MVIDSDMLEAIELKSKYEGVKMVLKELKREVKDRGIDTMDEFLELLDEMKEEYFGDESDDSSAD